MIYGTALLATCVLAGLIVGDVLGVLMGVESNVGGVGVAMLLLIVATDRLRRRGRGFSASESGILFWSAMYIPIVVAMASTQNVVAAVGAGPVALLAGVGATLLGLLALPLLARLGGRDAPLPPADEPEGL
ncbi:malonate transporter subunit MadL [Aurantiacibacter suaedae]|uniref:malonate transporter subunit MadL n=1 Tax=Aurantiacibacter suaedae TaxID=2545755 RepID=UPI0010F9344A|nr:malonate transporter subunit MadL [Aurantiacibacter suaedae]